MSVQNLLRNLVTEAQLNQQQSLRSQKMKELAAAAPRGQAARIAAPSPIVRAPNNSLGQGMSALGKALGDIGQMKKERAAKDAISALYAPPPMSEADLMEGVEPSAPQVNSTMLQRVLMQHPGTNAAKQGMSMVNMLAGQEQNKFMNEFRRDQLDQQETQNLRQIKSASDLKKMQLDYEAKKRFKPAGPLDYREQGIDPRDYKLSMNEFGETKMNYMPTYERRVALKREGVPRAEPRFEGQFVKDRGKAGSAYIDDVRKQSNSAIKTLSSNRRVDNLLSKIGTGTFTGARLKASDVARMFGISGENRKRFGLFNDDEIASGETMRSVASQFVFDALEAFTGAISEGEREYVQTVVPSLSTSPEGIKEIIRIKNAIANRAVIKGRMLEEWNADRAREGQKGSPEERDPNGDNFMQHYNKFLDSERGQLFPQAEKDRIEALRQEPPAVIEKTEGGIKYRKVEGEWFRVGDD